MFIKKESKKYSIAINVKEVYYKEMLSIFDIDVDNVDIVNVTFVDNHETIEDITYNVVRDNIIIHEGSIDESSRKVVDLLNDYLDDTIDSSDALSDVDKVDFSPSGLSFEDLMNDPSSGRISYVSEEIDFHDWKGRLIISVDDYMECSSNVIFNERFVGALSVIKTDVPFEKKVSDIEAGGMELDKDDKKDVDYIEYRYAEEKFLNGYHVDLEVVSGITAVEVVRELVSYIPTVKGIIGFYLDHPVNRYQNGWDLLEERLWV